MDNEDKINCFDDISQSEYFEEYLYNIPNMDNVTIECGGYERDIVGIPVENIFKSFPDNKMSEVKTLVAKELNKAFDTNFTEKNIRYFEEAWQDY